MSEVSATRPGRPKSEQKAKAIMSAATALFLAKGFQGTSMDAVARRAGVSKQTVYSHFANKEELFTACVRAKVASYGFDEAAAVADEDLRTALLTIARRLIDLLCDPEVVAAHRVVMSEAVSQPRIATLFFESGPRRTVNSLCAYLAKQVEEGRLRIADDRLPYAAGQFINSAFGMYQLEFLLSVRDTIPEDEVNQHLELVVDDFLSLYAVES